MNNVEKNQSPEIAKYYGAFGLGMAVGSPLGTTKPIPKAKSTVTMVANKDTNWYQIINTPGRYLGHGKGFARPTITVSVVGNPINSGDSLNVIPTVVKIKGTGYYQDQSSGYFVPVSDVSASKGVGIKGALGIGSSILRSGTSSVGSSTGTGLFGSIVGSTPTPSPTPKPTPTPASSGILGIFGVGAPTPTPVTKPSGGTATVGSPSPGLFGHMSLGTPAVQSISPVASTPPAPTPSPSIFGGGLPFYKPQPVVNSNTVMQIFLQYMSGVDTTQYPLNPNQFYNSYIANYGMPGGTPAQAANTIYNAYLAQNVNAPPPGNAYYGGYPTPPQYYGPPQPNYGGGYPPAPYGGYAPQPQYLGDNTTYTPSAQQPPYDDGNYPAPQPQYQPQDDGSGSYAPQDDGSGSYAPQDDGSGSQDDSQSQNNQGDFTGQSDDTNFSPQDDSMTTDDNIQAQVEAGMNGDDSNSADGTIGSRKKWAMDTYMHTPTGSHSSANGGTSGGGTTKKGRGTHTTHADGSMGHGKHHHHKHHLVHSDEATMMATGEIAGYVSQGSKW